MAKMHLQLRVNNKEVETLVEPRMLLIHLLREQLGITGPHIGCDTSPDMNGKSVKYRRRVPISSRSRAWLAAMEACIRCRRRFGNIMGCNAVSVPRG